MSCLCFCNFLAFVIVCGIDIYIYIDMYRYAFTQAFKACSCWACWAQEKFQLLLSSPMFAKALEARAASLPVGWVFAHS